MARFYTGGRSKAPASPLGGGRSSLTALGSGGFEPARNEDIGKLTFDASDPLASALGVLGGFGEFIGGAAGEIGELGIGDFQIKDAVEGIGANPIVQGAGSAIGAVGGAVVDVLGAPGRFVEEQYARKRLGADDPLANIVGLLGDVTEAAGGQVFGGALGLNRAMREREVRGAELPAEFQARLDAGEDIETLAKEMVEKGQGYSSNVTREIGLGLVLDPMNAIGPLFGGAAKAVTLSGRAVKAGEQVSRLESVVGRTYNAMSGGLKAGQQAAVRGAIGPITSGILHHSGIGNYTSLRSSLKGLNPVYASAFDDALAAGNAQLGDALIGKHMGEFYEPATRRLVANGRDFRGAMPSMDDVTTELTARRAAIGALDEGRFQMDIQQYYGRIAPDFVGLTAGQRAAQSAEKLAFITGQSVEDAARALGKVSTGKAQLVHLAFYGKAVDDLVAAKGAAVTATNIDVPRITILAPDTLDVDKATEILDAVERGDDIAPFVKQYADLSNRFLGKEYTAEKVGDFVRRLVKNDVLPQAVKQPISGRNKLPSALSDWRQKYEPSGYKLGFAPKDGWKAIIDDEGAVIVTDPFVHLQSAREAVTARNPLGRFADSLFRGVTQTVLVTEAEHRMTATAVKLGTGLSPNQSRAIFRATLANAADQGVAPRGLTALRGTFEIIENGTITKKTGNMIDEIFARHVTPEEMTAIRQKIDPTVLLMKGLEGNWNRIGLTQKFTGVAKVVGRETKLLPIAQIAEHIYPLLRFTFNPFFQLQEFLESPFFNALRGIRNVPVTDEVKDVYDAVAHLPEFRFVAEAGHVTHLAGAQATQEIVGKTTLIGKALSRYTSFPIQQRKQAARAAQVFAEHGEEFEKSVNALNPRLWEEMVTAYGTRDATVVAQRFFSERIRLASGDIEDAMKALDETRVAGLSPDEATVMEAWRESFRRTSTQAFKTHFFNPERGWLERTLNHPYLGLYPLSYMWGKVLPEFARFLVKRPFGLNAPLVGQAALVRVQQSLLVAYQDPELKKFLKDNSDVVFLLEMLLPGQPTNLPVNAPAWARHVVRDAQSGREINAETLTREARDTLEYIGRKPIQGLELGVKAAGNIYDSLEKAAAQYDTWAAPQ